MHDTAHQLMHLARDAFIAGNNDRALYYCDETLARDANLVDALLMRAQVTDDDAKAVTFAERVIKIDPDNYDAHEVAARKYAILEQYDRAEATWTRLIELAPEIADHWAERASTRLALDKEPEALADLGEALRLNPDAALANWHVGMYMMTKFSFERAIDAFNRAAEAEPEFFQPHSIRGQAHFFLRRYHEAIHDLEVAAAAQPGDSWDHLFLFRSYLALHQPERALKLLTKVDPDDLVESGWLIERAEALLQTGRMEEGRESMDAALRAIEEEGIDEEDEGGYEYEMAWWHARRAAMAERYNLLGADAAQCRDKAAEYLARAGAMNPDHVRFARFAPCFDVLWSRPELQALDVQDSMPGL